MSTRPRRTLKELLALPPPKMPQVTGGSKCPLCRARDSGNAKLEEAPSLEAILFSGLTTGITIGLTEKVDVRWCGDCREYVERATELMVAVRENIS